MKKLIIIILIILSILIILPILIIMIIPIIIASTFEDDAEMGANNGFVTCSETQSINKTMWEDAFSKAGVMSNSGKDFIEHANNYNIDPVLFAAIAMHETGWGKSNAVKQHNNPGGLMDPATNWSTVQRFPTLSSGIEAMARNLNRLINERGLITINDLGSVYAPPGAANDPTGLNLHWVPTVTEFASQFGGLTMNCEVLGKVELIGDKAWIVPHTKYITSGFGPRWGKNHNGIDIAGNNPRGKPIVSFMDGTVVVSTFGVSGSGYGGYGNIVIVEHSDNVKTVYAHMDDRMVAVGDKVKVGEQLGTLGNTGHSTGPHLHFEIRINDIAVDPMPYLTQFNPIKLN